MLKPCVTCRRLTYRHVELTWQCDRCRFQNLPPEVWTEIFGNLGAHDLLNIRLTCRTWKQLVEESPSLRRRLKAWIVGAEVTLDQDFEPGRLPPAAQIHIDVDRIVSVDSWWPAFGPRLVVLELMDNYISLKTLFGMLSQTPLLRELILIDNFYLGDPVGVDFRLDNLEKLVLQACDGRSKVILELFCEILPKFKYLAFYKDCDRELVLKLIVATQNTLKGLKLSATNEMLEVMAKLKNLQLRHVSMFSSPRILGKFIQTQQNIDGLNIDLQNFQILSGIVHHNLVRLTLYVNKEDTISLGHMPTLKYLEIHGPYRRICVNFNDFLTPNLEELRLAYILIMDTIMLNNLLNCSKLHLLKLADVYIDNAVKLAELSSNFNALKTLHINKSNITKIQLMYLFRHTPNLECLELKAVPKLKVEGVQFLCRKLVNLKRLALSSSRLGDSSTSAIIRYHGPKLRQLYFVAPRWNLTDEAMQKLQDHFSSRCSVQFCWVDDARSYLRDLVRF